MSRTTAVNLTSDEAQITYDVLAMVLNDPDWQDIATATDAEWRSLQRAASKILALRQR